MPTRDNASGGGEREDLGPGFKQMQLALYCERNSVRCEGPIALLPGTVVLLAFRKHGVLTLLCGLMFGLPQ